MVTVLFLCCYISCFGKEISIEKMKKFVPKSAIPSETHLFLGDLNRDGFIDALVRFKEKNEPIENEHFYLLLGKNDGTIKMFREDIFCFDHKNGMVFDTVTISKNGNFSVKYKGSENSYGSYRKITFKYLADESGYYCWDLNRDEELFQHKIFAPAPQKPMVITKSDMRNIGGELFGNIKENLYDALLQAKIKNQIPDSAYEYSAYSGDLNRDNYDDIILRFKIKNESEDREHFYLFVGQNNGTYKLAAKNDSVVVAGGVTLFKRVVIKNGFFSLEYEGFGVTIDSYEIITFKYSEENKKWSLHRQGSKSTHKYDVEANSAEEIVTPKNFGNVLFEDFRF